MEGGIFAVMVGIFVEMRERGKWSDGLVDGREWVEGVDSCNRPSYKVRGKVKGIEY